MTNVATPWATPGDGEPAELRPPGGQLTSIASALTPRRQAAVLATVCLAVFAINLDTTIVNVALPTIGHQLSAGTRTLQWFVDGYTLAFAALVLTGGSIGDRFGRRPTLAVGLVGFALASGIGALQSSADGLVTMRFVMGAFAALIYPTTLSIIANVFPSRKERAKAIGIWGGVTGLGVAVGPVCGGELLAHFWWGSIFLALVPLAIAAAVLTVVLVPESRKPDEARIDLLGLATSSAAIGLLVYTIIEAPGRGWLTARTLGGFALAALAALAFVLVERRSPRPMADLALFRFPAFSAASVSVTVAFFALFGFIFLITQYFQLIRGFGPLSTGVRILPVAGSIGLGSVVGALVASRIGTRVVVVTGLVLFGASFAWIATSPIGEAYGTIAMQMVVMGLGLGLTTAPATESIMSVLPAAKAGVGSAVNDATREAGGALGVAVVGSLYSSMYLRGLGKGVLAALPSPIATAARSSVGAGIEVSHRLTGPTARAAYDEVTSVFMHGFHVCCVVVACVCWAGALVALALPGKSRS